MNYLRLTTVNCVIIVLLFVLVLTPSYAQLFYDFEGFDYANNVLDRHLPDGYYYVNDGRIVPVSSDIRRKDFLLSGSDHVYYSPVVRVKHQKAKKKLFVPNLFG
ncbi:PREDICTED: uncharacterized protein LOC108978966 [Bactrocera latifrons]|uniref:Uncharacterized protein n=1 Tax=Bactrocera latifrons TaxID=174628 RepID=A0A0K8ULP9_BACLA|nr:PREDICTED: uncharacterized protein LOC108978966 [Bactrocera latifrons]